MPIPLSRYVCPRWLLLGIIVTLLNVGCEREYQTEYGRSYGKSVNGSRVFFDMLRERGHTVERAIRLDNSELTDYDVLVLFNKNVHIKHEAASWLGNWLTEREKRTVLYVGRDFDASLHVWDDARVDAIVAEDERLLRKAKYRFRQTLNELEWSTGDEDDASVYPVSQTGFRTQPAVFPDQTTPPGTRLYQHRYPMAVTDDVVLTDVDDHPFVIQKNANQSQLLLVANGSFLLNYSLIHAEHRKMASTLVDHLGDRQRICFLESTRLASDEFPFKFDLGTMTLNNPFRFLKHPGVCCLLLHWVVVALLYAVYRSPIFGRARHPTVHEPVQFTSHIRAYGRLLERTGDDRYAEQLIRDYETDGT